MHTLNRMASAAGAIPHALGTPRVPPIMSISVNSSRPGDAGDRGQQSCAPWVQPERSDPARKISLKSLGSLRGELTVAGTVPRIVTYESHLEKKVLVCLLARPDVVEVYGQPRPTVTYLDAQDVWRDHTFDFLAVRRNGERVAVSVKPSRRAAKHDLRGTLRLVAEHTPRSFADRVTLMTELHVPRDAYHNAKLILAMQGEDDEESDMGVLAIVETLNGVTTVGALVEASGREADGFAAVVRLIGRGRLRIVGRRRIDYSTEVSPAFAQEAGA